VARMLLALAARPEFRTKPIMAGEGNPRHGAVSAQRDEVAAKRE